MLIVRFHWTWSSRDLCHIPGETEGVIIQALSFSCSSGLLHIHSRIQWADLLVSDLLMLFSAFLDALGVHVYTTVTHFSAADKNLDLHPHQTADSSDVKTFFFSMHGRHWQVFGLFNKSFKFHGMWDLCSVFWAVSLRVVIDRWLRWGEQLQEDNEWTNRLCYMELMALQTSMS